MGKIFETTKELVGDETLTRHSIVKQPAPFAAFVWLDLHLAARYCPDWILLVLFLFRHTAMNGTPRGREIVLRKGFYELAGITTKDRRRKVLDHLEKNVPHSICKVERQRGKCARILLGPDWPHKT